MIRALKTACTANLTIVIATVIGYGLYGLSVDLPIDERFLGNGPAYPSGISTPRIPAWAFGIMIESVVVMVFIFLRYTEREMKGHRLLCAVIGLVGLVGLFLRKLPQLANGALPASFLQIDQTLAWYVWCSHLAYALTGPPRQLIAGMKANCIGSLLVGLAVVLSASPALARELTSDDLNYAITIPDGWTVAFQSGSGFSIASPDQNKTITLLVSKAGSGALDSDTIAEIERGLLLAGSEKVSGRNFTVDGVSAYETMHRFGKPPFASSFVGHLILASGKLYNLQGTHMGGDAARAADIQAALSSFRFLRAPKPPMSFVVRRSHVLWIVGVLLVGLIFWAVRNRAA